VTPETCLKKRFEKLVIEQIKQKILTQECLEELVKLVNEELDSTHGLLRDKLDIVDIELNDIKSRLSKILMTLENRQTGSGMIYLPASSN